MDEETRIYRRGKRNFQTTIPGAVLFNVNENNLRAGRVRARWSWNPRVRKWTVEFPVVEPEPDEGQSGTDGDTT